MVCNNCKQTSNHIKAYADGSESCHLCGQFSEAGGVRTSGLLTRQSFRVRSEQARFAADTLPPHKFDKASGKVVPSDDFIKKYPDQAKNYFDNADMKKAGVPKLAEHSDKLRAKEQAHKEALRKTREYAGSQKKAMEKVVRMSNGSDAKSKPQTEY